MTHYEIADLIKRWNRKALTADQVIGQILLLLLSLHRRLLKLESTPRRPN